MATITEDYVSFEVARLLEEKGFDEQTRFCFRGDGKILHNDESYVGYPGYYPRPTLQMAIKWLRKVHNINTDIVSVWNQKRFEYQVFIVTPENAKHCYIDDKLDLGHEEAEEAGIKYCLENLQT